MGWSNSKSKNIQSSNVTFPEPFLSSFENRYGRGFNMNELLGALPQTQSWLGGSPIQYGSQAGGGQPGMVPGTGGGGAVSGGGGGTIPWNIITGMVQSSFPDNPQKATNIIGGITQSARAQGIDLSQGLTLDQVRGLSGNRPENNPFVQAQLPGLLQGFVPQPDRNFAPTGGYDVSQLGIPQRLSQIFGPGADFNAQVQNIRNAPTIGAPVVGQSLMNVAPQGFDAYQNALYKGAYEPTARSVNQQGQLAQRQLEAELAGAGLASSGAGVGQLAQQQRQRNEQLMASSQQAAYQATQQRYGAEFAQQQFNAGQEQARKLANAGFDLDTQKTNAANVLAGDAAKADNYLKTMGLNQQAAQAMRQDFLNMVGITQKELERLDQSQMDKLGLVLNNWLQQGALLGNLGQRGQGLGTSGASSAKII